MLPTHSPLRRVAERPPRRIGRLYRDLRRIGAVAPSFPGSALLRPYPFPAISLRGVGEPERFSAPDEGFGVPVFDEDGIRMGPVANFVFRRGNRDGLYGVHQVGLTHEIGGFAEYSRWTISAPAPSCGRALTVTKVSSPLSARIFTPKPLFQGVGRSALQPRR